LLKNINQITTVNSGTAGKVLAVDANNQGSSGYKGLKWVDTSQVGATTFSALDRYTLCTRYSSSSISCKCCRYRFRI
jgi:hypothetical protein